MVEYETELLTCDHQIKDLFKRNQDLEKSNQDLEKSNQDLEKSNQDLEKSNQDLVKSNQDLEQEIERLKELLQAKGASKGSKKPRFRLEYSLQKNRGKRKRRKPSTGRRPQAQKLIFVSDTQEIYPSTVTPEECVERRQQYAWRITEGKAQYIRYTLYDLPESQELPTVPGLRNSRSEYGLEIILMVAFLHYWIGISLDHVCDVLRFFTGLELSKSQADSLLTQLSTDWKDQYDTIAELLALQLIIYVDETGWKVGKHSCYTWAFSTAMHVLFRCGVGRGKAEAQAILGDKFKGIGVSDDYGAYKNLFDEHQLCWAHLLRKAIKLMLQHPDEAQYSLFLEGLYEIYQQAVRYQKDRRLSVGRHDRAEQLQAKIIELCTRSGETIDLSEMPTHEATFIRLQNELVKGLPSLFVFVEHPEVEPTNNRSERNVRSEAEIRKGGRTSKTHNGANRRSIIMTVLATLNTRFEKFTLDKLLSEVARWIDAGHSIFQVELGELKYANPPPTS